MKSLYFVTGVCGVGKTAVLGPLKALLGPGFEVHDFDERGVPDNADRAWRLAETRRWADLAAENTQKNIVTIVCGFARPSEMEEDASVGFVLLDASEETIRRRLLNRYQTPESVAEIQRASGKTVQQFVADNVEFSSVLSKEAEQFGVDIVETDSLTPKQVAKEVLGRLGLGR